MTPSLLLAITSTTLGLCVALGVEMLGARKFVLGGCLFGVAAMLLPTAVGFAVLYASRLA